MISSPSQALPAKPPPQPLSQPPSSPHHSMFTPFYHDTNNTLPQEHRNPKRQYSQTDVASRYGQRNAQTKAFSHFYPLLLTNPSHARVNRGPRRPGSSRPALWSDPPRSHSHLRPINTLTHMLKNENPHRHSTPNPSSHHRVGTPDRPKPLIACREPLSPLSNCNPVIHQQSKLTTPALVPSSMNPT